MRAAIPDLPPAGADPYYTTNVMTVLVLSALYDSLTTIDRGGNLQPALATSWEATDEITWIFRLRPGVKFSNGEDFNSSAVVTALDYLKGPDGAATGVGREVAQIESYRMLDDLTVEVKTIAPYPILPRAFAALRVPAPEYWKALGPQAFAQDPVGTGPFKVDAWAPGRISFSAFEGAWRSPKFDKYEILAVPEQTARVQALVSGAVDIAMSISADDRGAVESAGATMYEAVSAGNLVISFRTGMDTPLKNRNVRRALNFAVNKQAMVDILMGGAGTVASQPVPPETLGFNLELEPYPYDPDRARQLLAQAGYSDGFEMTIEISGGDGSNTDAIYQMVASDLHQVGVAATLQVVPTQTLVNQIFQGGWKGEAFSMTMDTLPTLDALRPFRLHSCLWVSPWHCNEADTPVIEEAQRELDLEKRNALVQELLRRYHDDPPALYLVQVVGFVGLGKRIRNYVSDYGVIHYYDLELIE
jgi:peptide/nickel transport system substrate-binding protein